MYGFVCVGSSCLYYTCIIVCCNMLLLLAFGPTFAVSALESWWFHCLLVPGWTNVTGDAWIAVAGKLRAQGSFQSAG